MRIQFLDQYELVGLNLLGIQIEVVFDDALDLPLAPHIRARRLLLHRGITAFASKLRRPSAATFLIPRFFLVGDQVQLIVLLRLVLLRGALLL